MITMEPVGEAEAPPKKKKSHRKSNAARSYAAPIPEIAMRRHAKAMLDAGDNASVYARTHGLTDSQASRLSRIAGQMMLEEMAKHVNAPDVGDGKGEESRRYSITLGAHALETIQNAAFRAVEFLRKIENKPLERLTDRELKLQARALEIIAKVARLFRPLIESSGFDVIPRLPAPGESTAGDSIPQTTGDRIGDPLPPAPDDSPQTVGGMLI